LRTQKIGVVFILRILEAQIFIFFQIPVELKKFCCITSYQNEERVQYSPQEREGGGNADSAEIVPKALRGAGGELYTPSHIKAPSIMNKPHARLSTEELY
jgi:hypothetical protein